MLTMNLTYGYSRGRVETSYIRGCSAPIDFAGFFISDFVGSAATYLNKPTCRISGFQLPTPHGLRDFETRIYEMKNQLTFKSHTLTPVIVNNQPYLGVPQIAGALQYRNAKIIFDLYTRHADEFTPDMSFLTTVETAGGKQQVRVFSLRGCHLLAMFSKTPIAKEFRRWVLDLIEQHNQSTPALDAKAIGGIVKRCASAAIRSEFKQIVADTIREEVAPYLLKGGIKKSGVMADGLPYLNWVAGIVHGANALHVCMEGLEQRNRELLAEWSGLNAKAKEIKQIADSCRLDVIK